MLKKQVTEFNLCYRIEGKTLKEKVKNAINRTGDLKKFYDSYKNGKSNGELIVLYNLADGDIGSAGLTLLPHHSLPFGKDEEDGELMIILRVFVELYGHFESKCIYFIESVFDGPSSNQKIFNCLYETLEVQTKRFNRKYPFCII